MLRTVLGSRWIALILFQMCGLDSVSLRGAETALRIELVCCDLAGTTVDYGSTTPAIGFRKIFKGLKLEVTETELLGPMGKKKSDHVREVLNLPRIKEQWRSLHSGAEPSEADVTRITDQFIALDREIIPQTSTAIPGVPAALAQLHERGIKIAYTTGYPRVLMDLCLKNLREAQCPIDYSVAADEVTAGRPAPYLLQRCMQELRVNDVRRCLAVGDTASDMQAGKNAGFITVGVSRSGMLVGLTLEQQLQLPEQELQKRIAAARQKLLDDGADYVIDDVSRLPRLIEEIESGKATPAR